jgi:hypothetical protein
MKIGDLVRLCGMSYPQYVGMIGILVRDMAPGQWAVAINGRLHPYQVHDVSMRVVSESR